MNEENKRVEFPIFECFWCKEDVGNGSVTHDCEETPKLDLKKTLEILKDMAEDNPLTDVGKIAKEFTKVSWVKMDGESDECPACRMATLERSRGVVMGPWGGAIRCMTCDYKDSFMSYVGRKCIIVEPMDK